jgi:hypothetical protein
MTTNQNQFVEIAPNTFVRSWDDVKSGHLFATGLKTFLIRMKDGEYYHIKGDDIPPTLALWQARSLSFQVEGGEIPSDIAQWVGVVPEGGKRIPRNR